MAQKRNPQMEELLSAHLARRDEPNFALGNALSTYLALPGLRAFYPCGAHHMTVQGYYLDDIACDYDLAYGAEAGFPGLGFSNLHPWVYFDGDEYFYYIDNAQFDITGIDAPPMEVGNRGITVGAWVKFDELGGSETIVSKWDTAANRSYDLRKTAGSNIVFQISSNGGNVNTDTATSASSVSANTWYFVAGKWQLNIGIAAMLDGEITSAATTQASIFNSTAQFRLAQYASGQNSMTGYQAFVFVCSTALSDSILTNLYQQTRYIFGK